MSIIYEKNGGVEGHAYKNKSGQTSYNCRHYSSTANTNMTSHRSLSTDNKYAFKRPTTMPNRIEDGANLSSSSSSSSSSSPRKIKVKIASELKKSESMRKMSKRCLPNETPPPPPPPQPPPPPPPPDQETGKFKSKSYLLKTTEHSAHDSIASSLNLKRLLFSSTSANLSSNHHATISGVKSKKLASNVNLLQNNFSTAATCFLNGNASKKKRSSLFNLFSFKTASSPANNTVAVQQVVQQHKTPSPSPPHYHVRASVTSNKYSDEFVNDFSASAKPNDEQTFMQQVLNHFH